MDWNKLRAFYYVAKHQRITHAAEEMNITQSALSRQIIILEKRLKVKLFERKHDGLSLTREGTLLYQTTRKIFNEIEATNFLLSKGDTELEGTLKVETTVSLAQNWIAHHVGELSTRFPHINFIILGDDHLVPPDKNEVSVSIRPYMTDYEDRLIQEYLMTFHLRLYAHSSYLKNFGVPKNIEDLKHHRLIAFGDASVPYENINWHLHLTSTPIKPYFSINSGYGLLCAAEAGLGIVALSQEFIILKHSKLLPVLPDLKGPTIDVFYGYLKTIAKYERVLAFKDFMKETIKRIHSPEQDNNYDFERPKEIEKS